MYIEYYAVQPLGQRLNKKGIKYSEIISYMCWDKALRYVVENEGDTRYTLRDKYEEEKSPGGQGCVGSCEGKFAWRDKVSINLD